MENSRSDAIKISEEYEVVLGGMHGVKKHFAKKGHHLTLCGVRKYPFPAGKPAEGDMCPKCAAKAEFTERRTDQ